MAWMNILGETRGVIYQEREYVYHKQHIYILCRYLYFKVLM